MALKTGVELRWCGMEEVTLSGRVATHKRISMHKSDTWACLAHKALVRLCEALQQFRVLRVPRLGVYHWHDVFLLQGTLHHLSDAERTQAIVGRLESLWSFHASEMAQPIRGATS